MTARLVPAAAAIFAAALSVGCGTDTAESLTPEERGARSYASYCAPCHGEDLQGYAADNANALANQAFLSLATDAFLTDAIVYGRPGTPMSGWGEARAGPLDDGDVSDLVAYLRAQQTVPDQDVHEDVVEGIATKGVAVWNAVGCGDCHGEVGEGGEVAMSVNNPWFLATASDGYLRASIEQGRAGTSMQGYADVLGPIETGDLVALIRSWQVPVDETPLAPFTPTFDPDRDIINPGGGAPTWDLREGRFVAAADVMEAMDGGRELIVLDARPYSDYVDGHITGSVAIPFFELELVIDELPEDVWIVSYCGCPHTVSGLAFDALDAAGFSNIAVLDEGYYVWEELGYPISTGR